MEKEKFAFLQVNCKAHSGDLNSGKFFITKYGSLQCEQSSTKWVGGIGGSGSAIR